MNDSSTDSNSEHPQSMQRVFLVEDSVPLRELVIENLADIPGILVAGFAASEADALSWLEQNSWDILILDIELKQGNGISLLRHLYRQAAQPHQIKILFSNNVSDAYRRSVEQLGGKFFFDKTTEFAAMYALLERLGAGHNADDGATHA